MQKRLPGSAQFKNAPSTRCSHQVAAAFRPWIAALLFEVYYQVISMLRYQKRDYRKGGAKKDEEVTLDARGRDGDGDQSLWLNPSQAGRAPLHGADTVPKTRPPSKTHEVDVKQGKDPEQRVREKESEWNLCFEILSRPIHYHNYRVAGVYSEAVESEALVEDDETTTMVIWARSLKKKIKAQKMWVNKGIRCQRPPQSPQEPCLPPAVQPAMVDHCRPRRQLELPLCRPLRQPMTVSTDTATAAPPAEGDDDAAATLPRPADDPARDADDDGPSWGCLRQSTLDQCLSHWLAPRWPSALCPRNPACAHLTEWKTSAVSGNCIEQCLGQFGDVASNILKSEGGGDGGVASAEVADQAAGALGNALDAATEGVNPAAAKSLLGAATSVGDSFSADTSTSSIAQGARSAQLRVLFSKLGSALLQQVPAGSTSTVSTVEGGKGTAIAVAKEDAAAAAATGLSSGSTQIPGGGFGGRLRRLQSDCSTIAAQSTDFVGSNPFTYLESSLGQNAFVENGATVTTLEIKRCDSLVRSNWDPPIALTLPLNAAPGTPPEGYSYEPICVRLDETSTDLPKQEWTTDSMTWLLPSSYDATTVECFAATGGGSYAAIYVPVKLEATFTSTTGTATRTYMTTETSTSIPAIPAADGGMVVGVTLAAVALIVVVSVIGWQCYVGNVKVQKPEMPQQIMKQVSENCQRMKDKMRKSKVGIEPSTEPKEAWESKPQDPQASGRAQQDAADHFWDWANDLVKEGQGTPSGPPSKAFSVRSKSGSPPHLPPRFAVPKPSVEKQEYFQNFAQELRDIVSAGMPGMIADSPADIVPPPPPKRSVPSAPPRPPPSPPPWVRESAVLSTLPPPMVNAEKIEVRVDQAFSDWKNDFAVATLGSLGLGSSSLGSLGSPPKSAPGAEQETQEPPPPPPQPREPPKQLPVPPPRPGRPRRAPQSPTRALPSPSSPQTSQTSPLNGAEATLRSTAKAPPVPVAAVGLPMPPVPPREASHSSLSPLSPPSFKEGSQLSMAVPKHQPLHPPLPKGAPTVELPGAMDSGQVESEHTSTD
eukprot:s1590_g26.t1